jgi:transcriptional regulator with GAF, ATPase, and Fis domain
MQSELLRATQKQEVWRFGATRTLDINVFVVATSRDLKQLIDEGKL